MCLIINLNCRPLAEEGLFLTKLAPFQRINVQDLATVAGTTEIMGLKIFLADFSTPFSDNKADKVSMVEMADLILDQFLDYKMKI
jgi:hypothetical protein